MIDSSDYEKLKCDCQKCYYANNVIFSPALREKIFFSAAGFNHIVFKNHRHEREKPSQILRFKLVPLAKKLIELSTTYQEFEESIKEFQVKTRKKKIKQNKIVKYWGIIAIIDNRKIKVIVRSVGVNGNLHFWSIIPAWTTNKYRDNKFFATMKGNPEED